ncbi:hypothetical protein AB0N65_04560 [Paenarthrobacter sp. NPDC089322]|uniref:hypothetical protein n=1 Tax=Paenarthrobacter sp. NPDC089322 TaxID=3155065 RepID=UPI003430AEFE
MRSCRDTSPGQVQEHGRSEEGSAVVEFTFLALLLMVPVVYFVVTVGQIQGGSFAVVGAADQAAKVFVSQAEPDAATKAAEQSAVMALEDHGFSAAMADVEIICDPADCSSAGTAVTAVVRLTVPLPMVPFGDVLQLDAARLTASATQVQGRFH